MARTIRNRDLSPSTHHILPTSRGGTSCELNLITIRTTFHQAFHAVFANQTIDEQIKSLIELNRNSLDERAVQELFRLLNAYYKEERYKNEVIKNGVILPPK